MTACARWVVGLLAVLSAASTQADSLADARDLAARGKTLKLEAGTALSQGDRPAWAEKSAEALQTLRDAAHLYREAGAASSEDVQLLTEYANVLEESRDYDLAAEAYARLIELEPENPEWHARHGLALAEVGPLDRPDALASLKRALRMEPAPELFARAAAEVGDMYWDASHYDLAGHYFAEAYKREEGNVGAAGGLAAALIRTGQMAEAERVLGSLRSFRGDAMARLQGRIAQALNDFEHRRLWFEDTASNHLSYGRLLIRVGRNADAVLPLKRAVMLAPENTTALNLLGAVLVQTNDAAGARRAFERSLELNPNQPAVRESLKGLE